MKKIGIALIAVCLISGVSAAVAGAQMAAGKGMGAGMGMGGGCCMSGGMGMWDGAHAKYILDALDLNDNQSNQVKAVNLKLQKEMIQKRADIQVAELELREILAKDSVDVTLAETKVKQIAAIKTEAAMMHIRGIEEIKSYLTPEQKKKLSDMMQMRGMGHGKGMMDCPMMKGRNVEGGSDAAAPPAKSKMKKNIPPHQQNQ